MVRERKIIPIEPDDEDDGKNASKGGGTDEGQENSSIHVPGSGIMAPGENDTVLRPKRIADMVGQQEVMDVIQIAMDAAKKRGGLIGNLQRAGLAAAALATFVRLYTLPVLRNELTAEVRMAPAW